MIVAARPNLSDAEVRELEELLTEYGDIFAMKSDDYGWIDRVYRRIDTGNARPIRQSLRTLHLAKQAEVGKMLDDIQRREVIEESDSPWPSPVVLVWKKNGDLRFCVDYRELNDVTKKDCF
jgi:hypothetical protein